METLHLKSHNSVWKTSLTTGALASVGFIIIFIICKLLGLEQYTEIRIVNFILLFFLTGRAIRNYQQETHNGMNYFEGLTLGFLISSISFIIFGGFMMGYLYFDQEFMNYLKVNSPTGFYPTPLNSAFMMASEGIAAGSVIGLILMQYYKQNRYNTV
jgi:hypothetical protein